MKTLSAFLFLVLATAVVSDANATPAQIIMLRHAEEPENEAHNELSKRGWKRAEALVEFFQKKKFNKHGPAVAIYAMGQRHEDSSVRAIQTMTPLAEELGIEINDEYTREEYAEAAEEILTKRKYDGKLVIVCWQHKRLRDFAEELGLEDAPKWGGDVYDRVWVLDFEDDELEEFDSLPQNLLSGDSDE